LVVWPTALNYSVIPSEVEEPVMFFTVAPRDLSPSFRCAQDDNAACTLNRAGKILSPLSAPRQ